MAAFHSIYRSRRSSTAVKKSHALLASELIVVNWFKVESLGNTIGAVWNQMGAIIGGESNPPIGRVFKCIQNGN